MRRWLIGVAALLTAIGVLELVRPVHGPAYRSTNGASLAPFALHSRATKRDLHEILVLPHAGQAAFLLVLLHGRGAGPSSWLSQPFFDELHALGSRAPAVLLLDGADHSYWHDRRDGRWGSMVLHEAIPAGVTRTHATRVAIGGISMGGFGALDLGARGAFCAIGAHSAALWFTAGDTAGRVRRRRGLRAARPDPAPAGLSSTGVDGRRRRRSVPRRRHRARAEARRDAPRLAGRARRRVLAEPHGAVPAVLRERLRLTSAQ